MTRANNLYKFLVEVTSPIGICAEFLDPAPAELSDK